MYLFFNIGKTSIIHTHSWDNDNFCLSPGGEIDQNGVDSNLGEDSDSLGNSKTSKTSILPPTKEKRKPFFKKVSLCKCACMHVWVIDNMHTPTDCQADTSRHVTYLRKQLEVDLNCVALFSSSVYCLCRESADDVSVYLDRVVVFTSAGGC